jgi:hypothetical protein
MTLTLTDLYSSPFTVATVGGAACSVTAFYGRQQSFASGFQVGEVDPLPLNNSNLIAVISGFY